MLDTRNPFGTLAEIVTSARNFAARYCVIIYRLKSRRTCRDSAKRSALRQQLSKLSFATPYQLEAIYPFV
jgi:hypothetical protein